MQKTTIPHTPKYDWVIKTNFLPEHPYTATSQFALEADNSNKG